MLSDVWLQGGGGSVGDLVILWDPLPRYDHNGANLRYVVHYRKQDTSNTDDESNWQMSVSNVYKSPPCGSHDNY